MFVIDEAERFWLKRRRWLLKRHPRMPIFKINRLARGKRVRLGDRPKGKNLFSTSEDGVEEFICRGFLPEERRLKPTLQAEARATFLRQAEMRDIWQRMAPPHKPPAHH
jgi:hypothetical protein